MMLGRHFCVNVLRNDQAELSAAFSGALAAEARFKLGSWLRPSSEGVSYLADAQINLFCRKVAASALWHAHDLYRRGGSREGARPDRAFNLSGCDLLLLGNQRELGGTSGFLRARSRRQPLAISGRTKWALQHRGRITAGPQLCRALTLRS